MVVLRVAEELRPLLYSSWRRRVRAGGLLDSLVPDPDAALSHLVPSVGIPLTEVGELRATDGHRLEPAYQPDPGETVAVEPVARPQPLAEPRFLLDVHLGTLARRLRLLGLDVAYGNDADDDELVAQAIGEHRVLLTRDRGLLMRRALPAGAYVRGERPDAQVRDVLERFEPPLAPLTRCVACGARLRPAAREEVLAEIEPGTRRTATSFTRCTGCDRVYWRGAHATRLDSLIADATAGIGQPTRAAEPNS